MYINDRQQPSRECKCINGGPLEINEVEHSSKFVQIYKMLSYMIIQIDNAFPFSNKWLFITFVNVMYEMLS